MYSSDLEAIIAMIIATTTSSPAMTGLFLGIMIFSIILGLISVISYWKVFNKAGKPGIASIIPIYNCIVMIQIAKLSLVYLVLLLIPVVNIFAIFKINIEIAKKFGNKTGFGVGMTLLPIIFAPLLAFSDNVYEENIKEVETPNNDVNNTPTNVASETNNNIETETIIEAPINNIELNNESVDRVNSIENTEQPNTNEQVVEMVAPVIENTSPISNDIPVVEEAKVESTPTLNAFNSSPIETQNINEVTPSIDVKINNEISVEQSVEPIKPIEEITQQTITEIPVINDETNTIEQKKVCKNCGEVLPSIVSICPKCGTDNE